MINILYICTPNSIHDIKWMSYFAVQKDKFRVYSIGEEQCVLSEADCAILKNNNIIFLDLIPSYSITNPYKTFSTARWINKIIAKFKIDLVHVFVPTPLALWLLHIKKPYVITTRGTDVLVTLPNLYNNRWKNIKSFVFFRLFKFVFQKASYVTSTSYAQIDSIGKMFTIKNKILIRTGVDVERIKEINEYSEVNKILKDKQFVFSPRQVNNPIYNVEMQIESIKLLDQSIIDNYTFVFINKNNMNKDYYSFIEEKLNILSSQIGLSFLLLDSLSQEHLWQFYKKAKLTIMTPISDGTPNTALEAMAAKCPLILPCLPYDSDLFDSTCLKMYSNTPECLAELIKQALFDYPQSLIKDGYEKVTLLGNRFVEMNKLMDIYLSLINKKEL